MAKIEIAELADGTKVSVCLPSWLYKRIEADATIQEIEKFLEEERWLK